MVLPDPIWMAAERMAIKANVPRLQMPIHGRDPLEPPLQSNPGALQLERFVLLAPAHDLLHVLWCAFSSLPKVFAQENLQGLEELVIDACLVPEVGGSILQLVEPSSPFPGSIAQAGN